MSHNEMRILIIMPETESETGFLVEIIFWRGMGKAHTLKGSKESRIRKKRDLIKNMSYLYHSTL